MSDQAGNGSNANGGAKDATAQSFEIKVGLAEMLKGGVIMDVVDDTQAAIAAEAGAVAVMALERVPADIRKDGGDVGEDTQAAPPSVQAPKGSPRQGPSWPTGSQRSSLRRNNFLGNRA